MGLNVAAVVIRKCACACAFNAQRFARFNGFVRCGYTRCFAVACNGEARASRISGICHSFQLVFGGGTTAGNRRSGRVPSDVGQACYSACCTVNFHRFACCCITYGNNICQSKINTVIAYFGNNVAIACVFNGFTQFHSIHCATIGINLEAIVYQVLNAVVQIASIYSTISIGWVGNVACAGYVIQRCAACHGHNAVSVFGGRSSGCCAVCTLHRGDDVGRLYRCA